MNGNDPIIINQGEYANILKGNKVNVSETKDLVEKLIADRLQEVGEKINQKIEDLKKEFFVIFGLFASVVTFVVGGLSIVKTETNITEKVALLLFFAAGMLSFLLGMYFVVGDKIQKEKVRVIGGLLAALILWGLFLLLLPLVL
jgi:hypothetical protein